MERRASADHCSCQLPTALTISREENAMQVQPYLFFEGRAEEAIEFYKKALGTKEAEAKRLFDALADGGQVHLPLSKTVFSPGFGMLADRFGVNWMINTTA